MGTNHKELNEKKILVTGSAGFIGSHLVEKLCSLGNEVTIFDNMMRGNESFRNLNEVYQTCKPNLVIGDIRDYDQLKQLIGKGFDVIFHLAALPSHRLALERPRDYALIDLIGTVNVLEAMRITESSDTFLVFGSSNKVYGKQECPWREDKPLLPEGPYAQAKASSEEICRQYQKYYNVNSVVLRYHHVAGPRSNSDLALAIFVERVLKGLSPEIHGKFDSGKFTPCSADYTHINDAIEATLLSTYMIKDFEIVNIANSKLTTLLEMANLVIKYLDSDLEPKFVNMLPHETLMHHSDVSKAKKLLGFEAKIPVETAIKDYIDWRLKYRDSF